MSVCCGRLGSRHAFLRISLHFHIVIVSRPPCYCAHRYVTMPACTHRTIVQEYNEVLMFFCAREL